MVRKILGYVLAVVGIAGIIVSSEGVRKAISLPLPDTISNNLLLIISLIIIAIGLALALKGTNAKQSPEVPIYEGKNVVGYRRMKK